MTHADRLSAESLTLAYGDREVVHDLLEATQRNEAEGSAASLPMQQGEPTLKAGSSVPKQPYTYGGVQAWTSLEARNFKVRRARRLPCDH